MPTKTVLFTQIGTSSFTVPADFGSLVSFEAIGGGGAQASFSSRSAGSGGGAYAKSTFSNNLAPGKVLEVSVGTRGNRNAENNGGNSSVRDPSNSFTYVQAEGGRGASGSTVGIGGRTANCLGSGPFYSGGNGGSATQTHSKGGGGGAGGPGGNGGTGGAGIGTSISLQGGGGGGGAGGTAAGSNGDTGVQSTNGGNGGADGNSNPGGLGSNLSLSRTATTPSSSNGGGGGGYGSSSSTTLRNAAIGGNSAIIWTSVDGTVAAPGGGSGGGFQAADGGTYGGGAGGASQDNGIGVGNGFGGQGLVAFTYNVAANASATPFSVGQSGVANFVNTTSSAVTKVVANNGLGSYSPVVVGSGGPANPTLTISANQANVGINVVDIVGYKTGISNITITVNAGVNVYSTVSTTPSLFIFGANPGDTVTLVNNGNIIGYGGNGGLLQDGGGPATQAAVAGFTALSVFSNITVVNNGNIGGGGGGGGASRDRFIGGGGAGGGTGNPDLGNRSISFSSPGPNGQEVNYPVGCCCNFQYYGGGSGGYIISTPTGGSLGTISSASVGVGGNAGGSGSASGGISYTPGNDGGGTGNAPIPNNQVGPSIAGGGGGFGGSGSAGYSNDPAPFIRQVGAVGGYSITKNGKTVTVSGSGNIYGTQLP